MNRWTVLFAAILVSLFVAIGCSGGGGGSPVAPSAGQEIPPLHAERCRAPIA